MMWNRPVASAVTVPAPSMSPTIGTILSSQTISISISGTATSAEYSFDNDTWVTYTSPFTLANDATVYARATDGNGNYSSIVSNSYVVATQIEYIKTASGAYINTGYTPTNTTGIYLDYKRTSTTDRYYMGCRNSSSTNTRFGIGHSSNLYYGWGTYTTISGYTGTSRRKVALNLYNSRTVTVGGASTSVSLSALDFTPDKPMFIGTYNNGGNPGGITAANIYAAQITEGNNLVRDYVAARVGQVGYLYEKISGTLLGSAGSGSFTLGSDVTS